MTHLRSNQTKSSELEKPNCHIQILISTNSKMQYHVCHSASVDMLLKSMSVAHLVDGEVLGEAPGDPDQLCQLVVLPLLGWRLVLLVVHQQAHLERQAQQSLRF